MYYCFYCTRLFYQFSKASVIWKKKKNSTNDDDTKITRLFIFTSQALIQFVSVTLFVSVCHLPVTVIDLSNSCTVRCIVTSLGHASLLRLCECHARIRFYPLTPIPPEFLFFLFFNPQPRTSVIGGEIRPIDYSSLPPCMQKETGAKESVLAVRVTGK